MLEIMAVAPNWDKWYGSLWLRSVALVALALIFIMIAPAIYKRLRKKPKGKVIGAVLIVLAMLIVGFLAVLVAEDLIMINHFKNMDYDCGPTMSEDGNLVMSDKPCY